jgi:aryl-alcohol dehydrogenase-like predicted oxidoreductase
MHGFVEATLRTITIRNMPADLEKRIEAMAREEGASLAQTVIRLLLRATGLHLRGPGASSGSPVRHHELDALAGTWSAEDAAEFDRAVGVQRRIDPDVWD